MSKHFRLALLSLFAVAALGALAIAQQDGGWATFQAIRWANTSGVTGVRAMANSSNQVEFQAMALGGAAALTIDDDGGGVGFLSRTVAQIQASTPTAGRVFYDSANKLLVVGNGTDFLRVSSMTTMAAGGTQVKAYP